MNSNDLYTGEFYAWFPNRPKGRIPLGAAKVTIDYIARSKSTWEKNRRTEVTITIIEKGTGYGIGHYEAGRKVTVPARELIDYWNEYKDEVAHLEAEQRQKEYDRKKIGSRRRALAKLIGSKLEPMGLPNGTATVESNWAATIPLDALLTWLRISERDIEATVLEDIGPPPERVATGYTTD